MANVLEISPYPPPHAGWAVRVAHVRKRLLAEGHACVVLNIGESRRVPSPDYETVENGWVYVRKVTRYARRRFVVHMHLNGDSPKGFVLTFLAEAIARLLGAPCVLTFHAGTDQVYFPKNKSVMMAPVLTLLFRLARAIICNSEAVKGRITEYGVPPARIVPIPGFSRQYLEFTATTLPGEIEGFFARHADVVFSYLAMVPSFRPQVLIEAFRHIAAELPGTGLFLCGVTARAEDDVTHRVRDLIDSYGLSQSVLMVGDLSHDQFLTALARSTLCVRTPTSDGVSASVLEALALGVPVVASENGNRPPGVLTYPAADARALAETTVQVLRQGGTAARGPTPEVQDTVQQEAELLVALHGT